jgi:60 kDa SS-A/Ro ribonucleoprotein
MNLNTFQRNGVFQNALYAHKQAKERADILNVGGFSDQVFTLVSEFAGGTLDAEHWVGVIEKVEL